MRHLIIISDIEASSLKLAQDFAKSDIHIELYLLSDAVFMLNDNKLSKLFEDIQELGTLVFTLKEDFEKRVPVFKDYINLISYEEFVERLLSNEVKIINL